MEEEGRAPRSKSAKRGLEYPEDDPYNAHEADPYLHPVPMDPYAVNVDKEEEDRFMNQAGLAGELPLPGSPLGQRDVQIIHAELRRLSIVEKDLLNSNDLSPYEKADVKDQFYHQKMELICRLPEAEQKRYHPQEINKMGVSRHNINFEEVITHRPYFIVCVFVTNLVMFLVEMAQNGWTVESLSLNPMIGPSSATLDSIGAKNGYKIQHGQWWRLIAPMFMHAGVIHLLMNTIVLMRLGWSMEVAFGTVRVAIIYLECGVFANVMSAVFLPNVLVVGASGALFGLIGALFGDFIQNHKMMTEGKWRYLFNLSLSSAFGLVLGLMPLLDNFSHVGGWLMGLISGTAFLAGVIKDVDGNSVIAWYGTPAIVVSLILQGAFFITGFIVLFNNVDVNGWCHWCRNISCVPTPWWSCDQYAN